MTRRGLWVAVAAVLGCLGVASLAPEAAPPDDRANVVVIMTDDMRLDELAYMPNVQRLMVDRGVTFEQAVASYPLCCPARATVLTGQYAHNHGVEGNGWPRGGAQRLDDDNTLPVWLESSGYSTALVGKYLNGYPGDDDEYVPPGWEDWYVPIAGTYNFRGIIANVNGEHVEHLGEYGSLVIDAASADIAEVRAASSRPFFLWSSYVAPHTECLRRARDSCWGPPRPAPMDQGTYAGLPLPSSAAMDEEDMSDKGPRLQRLTTMSDERRSRMQWARVQRVESLQAVDRGVAHLIDRLQETGELDNTYLVFTSDNGYSLGEHRLSGRKTYGYEEIVRVPLVMTGPGITAGTTVRQSVTLGDLTTTIAEIAGIRAGRPADGESLLSLARGVGPDTLDRIVPIEAAPVDNRSPGWMYQGLRTDRYTLIRWADGFVELYDRDRDPAQVESVTYEPDYAEVRSYLESELDVLDDCAGQECLRWYEGPDVAIR